MKGKEDDAAWKQVKRRGKQFGKQGAGQQQGSGKQGAKGGDGPSKAQRELWFKEGKCLRCGSADHRKADCPQLNA